MKLPLFDAEAEEGALAVAPLLEPRRSRVGGTTTDDRCGLCACPVLNVSTGAGCPMLPRDDAEVDGDR